jgi:putative oxidoreductase
MNSLFLDLGLFIMRVSFALMMLIGHGLPKLQMATSGDPIKFADPIGMGVTVSLWAAVFSEFLCSLFVTIGFQTRIACGFLVFTMLVAAFVVHAADPFFMKKEFPLMYAFLFLGLMATGPGRYSVDGWRKR